MYPPVMFSNVYASVFLAPLHGTLDLFVCDIYIGTHIHSCLPPQDTPLAVKDHRELIFTSALVQCLTHSWHEKEVN